MLKQAIPNIFVHPRRLVTLFDGFADGNPCPLGSTSFESHGAALGMDVFRLTMNATGHPLPGSLV